MANIGISRASYYADTSLVRFSNEGMKSVDRLSSAQSDVVNGEIATLSGMNYTFKMDVAAAKASIKSLSTTQAYLTTAITALDNASHTLSQIQELAVLGANGSNSEADHAALNARAEELADQFHDVMSGSKYKNENIFDPNRLNAKMANGSGGSIDFGLAEIDYDFFYDYKNPNTNLLDSGVKYEVTRELTDAEKEAIVSRTEGVTVDDLVQGATFTTLSAPDVNLGGGTISVISEEPPANNTKTYNRGDGNVRFDSTAEVLQEGNFKGGYVDIEITGNIETSDNLSLENTTRVHNGLVIDSVRVVDGIVSYNDPEHGFIDIGRVVEETNGAAGKKLRIELFDDATIPGTGILENGDFEKPILEEGARPTKTYTPGEARSGVLDGYVIRGGANYQSNGDQPYTGLAADSDTLNIELVNLRGPGSNGSGFRANVEITNGSITAIHVIDKGSEYVVGDVLTFAGDELGGSGAGFELEVTAVSDSVELITSPNYDTVRAWERQAGNGTYAWGEAYNAGDKVKEEVLNVADADETRLRRHIANGNYAWGEAYNVGDVVKEEVLNEADADDTVYVTQAGAGTYAWGENYNAGDIVKEEVLNVADADETRLRRHLVNGNYAWGEAYNAGDVVKEQVNNAADADDTVYVRQAGAGTYSWGEAYNAGDIVKVEVFNQAEADNTILKRHLVNGNYAWGEAYNAGDVVKEQVNNAADADDTVYVRQAGAGTYSWGEAYNAGDIVKVEVFNQAEADNTILKRHLVNGNYAWGEAYNAGDVVKEQVNNAADADDTVYVRQAGAGTYSWGEAYNAGDIVKVEVFNQAEADNTILKRHLVNGNYAWGEAYNAGDVVKEQVNNAADADDTVYVRQAGAGTYSWGEAYNAGDIVKVEVFNQAEADNTILKRHIANGTYAWGETYNIGDVVKEQVLNPGDAQHTYYRTHAANGIYAWGEAYNAGDVAKEEVLNPADADNAVLKRHIANGTYAWGETYNIGDVVKEQVVNPADADDIVYLRHTQNGTYEWGEAYNAGDVVKERTQTGTISVPTGEVDEFGDAITEDQPVYRFDDVIDYYTRNVEIYTRDIIDAYTRNSEIYTRNVVDYHTRNVEVHTQNQVDYHTRNVSVYTQNTVDYYTQNVEVLTKNTVDYYTRDVEVHTREKVGTYTRNLNVHTRLVEIDPISRYLGEIELDPQPQVHTGWEQGTTDYIQNWYFSDDNRILFGQGNNNGEFIIHDTENGALITSNTVDGAFVDNSKRILVPTPSWNDMALPEYEDYVVNANLTRVSDETLEGRDDHPLKVEAGGIFTTPSGRQIDLGDPGIGLIDSDGGKAMELDTGGLVFDDGNGFGIYHGPAIVSDVFEVTVDQPKIVRLDYSALGKNDDYHVAGYIYEVNPDTGEYLVDPETGKAKITMTVNETDTEVDGRAGIEVPNPGHFRFVFVVGTHDLTGGLLAGANMTVDNIVAEDPYEITDDIIQELLRAVHYNNSADAAAGTKTLTATVESGDETLFLTDNALINMSGFDPLGENGPYMIVPSNNLVTDPEAGVANGSASALTSKVELLQQKIDALRTQAGSKVSAIESAIDSATDLRSQFALASGTLSDVNFSLETVHAAKRQIQQDVAAAMMAQANKAQDGMLSLVAEAETKP